MNAPAAPAQRAYVNLTPGDPAPWFTQRLGEEGYAIHRAGGRYVVLCFFASAANEAGKAAMALAAENPRLFDDGGKVSFFGVSLDRTDAERLGDSPRWFRDFDGTIARAYGALPHDVRPEDKNVPARRFWMVLDPMLRVLKVVPFAADGADRARR